MARQVDIAPLVVDDRFTRPMIPGAREPGMLTTFGVQPVVVLDGGRTMDAATIASHQRAGGGGPDQRRRAREQSRWYILAQNLRQFLTGSRRKETAFPRAISIAITSRRSDP